MEQSVDPVVQHTIWTMVLGSGPVVQFVLVLLIALSIWSWAITISKIVQFRRARSASQSFSSIFWESRNLARIDDSTRRLAASPLAQVFMSGYKELAHVVQGGDSGRGSAARVDSYLHTVERALRRAELDEAVKLEQGITFLATVASAAPFVGLFGTVWGIMNAFHGLSNNASSTLQAVAPGISEALVATAIGLAAAIPAAVAYNYFAVGVRQFRESMARFSEEFLTLARLYFESK